MRKSYSNIKLLFVLCYENQATTSFTNRELGECIGLKMDYIQKLLKELREGGFIQYDYIVIDDIAHRKIFVTNKGEHYLKTNIYRITENQLNDIKSNIKNMMKDREYDL